MFNHEDRIFKFISMIVFSFEFYPEAPYPTTSSSISTFTHRFDKWVFNLIFGYFLVPNKAIADGQIDKKLFKCNELDNTFEFIVPRKATNKKSLHDLL